MTATPTTPAADDSGSPREDRQPAGADFALPSMDLAALRWFDPAGRAVQRLHASEQCDVIVVGWEAGQQSSYHDHGVSESVVIVVEGRITAESEGATRVLGPAEVLVTPRGAHHRMRNDGPERAVTFHVYAPPMSGGVSAPYRDHTTPSD
ncbi:cupin domain-containing protein [Kitasatospora viridis]|uniref:Cysteine dioxygenase type I n=1 Tax=Kitasatospora viridis TaxID=281105 RepID=A0A561T6B9_9ACTN|nr:cupin domain-containing protein [Kitasatospora viridis]TWF82661.1 cysteine dioxygenase type I [Kitasatospora viridis]